MERQTKIIAIANQKGGDGDDDDDDDVFDHGLAGAGILFHGWNLLMGN